MDVGDLLLYTPGSVGGHYESESRVKRKGCVWSKKRAEGSSCRQREEPDTRYVCQPEALRQQLIASRELSRVMQDSV